MTTRIGDRPRFPITNQRFDKGDAENIASYYEDIISRFTGSIYGQAWGCISNPGFNLVTVALGGGNYERQLRFGTCALLHSTPASNTLNSTSADTGPWTAVVTVHDSSRESQPVQSLSLTAAAMQGQRPWVLFKRQETATALGNKAYWDTSTNTEAIESAMLQQSEYVQFKLSTSYSETQRLDGWYRMAYIDSFSGSGVNLTAVVVPIHWMDSQYYDDVLPPAPGTVVASALAFPGFPGAVGTFGFNPSAEMPELAKLMHWTIGKLGQHFSTANTVQVTAPFADTYKVKPGAFISNYTGDGGWLATPPRGLVELDADLTFTSSNLSGLEEAVNALTVAFDDFSLKVARTTRLLHTLYVTPVYNGSSTWTTYTFDVRVTSVQEPSSLAPRLGTWGDSAATLRYAFVPQILGAPDGRYITLTLGGALATTAAPTYEVSSVVITAHEDPMIGTSGAWDKPIVPQRYTNATGPVVLPPAILTGSTELVVFFSVWSTDEDEGRARPFTVNIYGRNV